MNPEFYRNLLLELTLHRLIAMPLILLLIYAAAGLGGDAGTVSEVAWYAVMGMLVLWGTRLAADAVLGEVVSRTWDSQRMSTIGPFAMGWAKLLGSTVYVWYGAALSAPALLYGRERDFDDLLRIVMVGLFAQTVALFVSLLVQRLRPERLRFQVTASQLFGIGAAVSYWSVLQDAPSGLVGRGEMSWYGLSFPRDEFLLASALAFLAWGWFGVYRLMRTELQFRCWPVGWTAFVAFCGVYTGGFQIDRGLARTGIFDIPSTGTVSQLLAAYLTVLTLVWLAAYAEPKGLVRLRRWGAALRGRDPRRILEATPAWVPGMLLGVVVGIVLVLVWSLSAETRDVYAGFLNMESLAAFAVALFLFLLRDIGVIHFITLDGRKRRAHMTALVYLVVLYVLFPIVLATADWEGALPAFLPHTQGHPLVITLPVLVQVAIVGALLVVRWKRVAGAMAAA
ncbi:MAG: hypothetical protein OEN55_17815 [Alphaproteobacteria bacterium]|nr:hypothetical protein [Alphaproteobacteria bacterium]